MAFTLLDIGFFLLPFLFIIIGAKARVPAFSFLAGLLFLLLAFFEPVPLWFRLLFIGLGFLFMGGSVYVARTK